MGGRRNRDGVIDSTNKCSDGAASNPTSQENRTNKYRIYAVFFLVPNPPTPPYA